MALKSATIFWYGSIHLLIIFLQLYKRAEFTKQSFVKQHQEREYAALLEQKDALMHELQLLHDKNLIKRFAQTKLHMQPIKLTQITRISA